MDKEHSRELVVKMNCALELERRIVGAKFLFTKEDFEQDSARQIKNKLNYCVMVRLAMSGRALKATGKGLVCLESARALGLEEIDDYHRSGQKGQKLGLYRDMATSKRVRDTMSYCDHNAYGIVVKPVADYDHTPDVVILVTNPYNVMRIVQAYSYSYGLFTHYKMAGMAAICSESTAYPYLNNDINVSMLCIGTRHRAGWKDSELAVAFPFNRFDQIVEGLMATINSMDNNEKKGRIEEKLRANGIHDFEVKYDYNYYVSAWWPHRYQL